MKKLRLKKPHNNRAIGILFALVAGVTLALMGGCGNSLLGIPIGSTPAPDITIKLTADPVATPEAAAAIPADTTSCTITWTTTYSGTSYLEWGTATGSYPNTTTPEATAATSHGANLSGLAWGTTYYYRVRSASANNGVHVSGEYSFVTATVTTATLGQRMRGIWIVGGLSGAGIGTTVSNVDLFDPVTGNWYNNIATLPTPVSFAGYAGYNGSIYVIGGFNAAGTAQSLVQTYTILTNAWTAGTAMPAARANIHATTSNGKIYIMGGTAATAPTAWAGQTTNYEYTIGSPGSWNTRTSFGAATSERFSYAYNDVVYNIGGRSGAAAVAAPAHDAYVYANNLLSTGVAETAMATARSGVAGAISIPALGPASVILIGGVSTFAGTTGCFVNQAATTPTLSNLQQQLAYPFTAPSAWAIPTSGASTYPSAIAFGAAVVSTANSPARFYYFGGVTSFGTTTSVTAAGYWCNVPTTSATTWDGTWTAYTNMGTARWGHGAVTVQ